MNQMQTCKLNQWEKSDRFQMEDFDNDNSRLEAALDALQTTIIMLAEERKAFTLKTGTRPLKASCPARFCGSIVFFKVVFRLLSW